MPETLTCPVCRAQQPVQPVCRRCCADLELLKRALLAVDRVRDQLDQARQSNAEAENISGLQSRLHWLSPGALHPDRGV